MAAHQAPPSLGFSRKEHWSGLPISFSNAWKWKVKVKSLSCIRLFATHGLQPTRLLRPWDFPGREISGIFWATREAQSESDSVVSDCLRHHGLHSPWNSPGQNTGVGSCSLLQRIFPTQGLNPGLPYYKWILYQLSHNGSQKIHYLTHTINSLFCMMYKYSLILWCAIHACHTLWGKKITTIMVFKKIILWKQLFQNMWHGSYPGRWSRKRGLPGCAYWSSWAPCIFLSEMLTEHQPSKAS